MLTANIPGLEQTLVTFPRVIASGFTGTPGDGYGHINLQLNNSVMPCTKGYLPTGSWRPATDLTDKPYYPTQVPVGRPKNHARHQVRAQHRVGESTGRSYRVSPYDATTGGSMPATGRPGARMGGGLHTVFGDDSWKWMLTGPVTAE